MTEAAYLAGRLLLALPGMGDPRFDRAVIAMCAHDENGALGIGIGHAHPRLRFRDLLENVGVEVGAAPDAPVHVGGPVEPSRGFVLHTPEWSDADTLAVGEAWSLSASLDVLRAIAAGEGPRRWLFALGYAGWGAGQLDEELHHHGWHATDPHGALMFDTGAEDRWGAVWRAEGIDPALLSNVTGRA